MPLSQDQENPEHARRMELTQADLSLNKQQSIWETPRNIALLAGAVAAIVGTLAGVLGFKLGQTSPAPSPPRIIYLQPGPPPAR